MKTIKRIQKRDPMFMRKVFVSHYCNIPFHLLDKRFADQVKRDGYYPSELVLDLYAASFHLVRNFDLAPFASDTKLEDLISDLVDKEKL